MGDDSTYGQEIINLNNLLKEATEQNQTEQKLVPIKKGDKWGFADDKGNIVILCKYDSVQPFSEGLAAFELLDDEWGGSDWGYINTKGKIVILPIYDKAYSFSEGLAVVATINDNWEYGLGYINKRGSFVIPAIYHKAKSFSGGIAKVKRKKKIYYINRKGRCIQNCP